MISEIAFTFPSRDAELVGILHPGANAASRGVLIVVGGPQYRVGSHRQFVLLARELAKAGIPVMRFDYRGIGDAGGELATFEDIDDDIASALDVFFEHCPGLREVVIWGLCDAASAALFYAWRDARVTGLVLLNPWVRTEAGIAQAYLKHYYLTRLIDPELWQKIRQGKFDLALSFRSLAVMITKTLSKNSWIARYKSVESQTTTASMPPLPERMAEGFKRFTGPVLVILSGNDLTAGEFKDTIKASKTWRKLMSRPQVARTDLPEANHTFSRGTWRDQVAVQTIQWIKSW